MKYNIGLPSSEWAEDGFYYLTGCEELTDLKSILGSQDARLLPPPKGYSESEMLEIVRHLIPIFGEVSVIAEEWPEDKRIHMGYDPFVVP